jgi:hypothetical protein
MALQSSGAISLADVAGEFGGSTPHSLSEYYRGGSFVGSFVTAVPASGAISLSDFYGTENYITPVAGVTYFSISGGLTLSTLNGAIGTGSAGSATDTDGGENNVDTYAEVISSGTRAYTITNTNLVGNVRAYITASNSSSASTDDGFVAIGHYRSGSLISGQWFGWSPSFAGANVDVTRSFDFTLQANDTLEYWVASAAGGSVNYSSSSTTTFKSGSVDGR